MLDSLCYLWQHSLLYWGYLCCILHCLRCLLWVNHCLQSMLPLLWALC